MRRRRLRAERSCGNQTRSFTAHSRASRYPSVEWLPWNVLARLRGDERCLRPLNLIGFALDFAAARLSIGDRIGIDATRARPQPLRNPMQMKDILHGLPRFDHFHLLAVDKHGSRARHAAILRRSSLSIHASVQDYEGVIAPELRHRAVSPHDGGNAGRPHYRCSLAIWPRHSGCGNDVIGATAKNSEPFRRSCQTASAPPLLHSDISVMPVIAARTVAVLSNAPALRTEPATAGKRRRNRPTRRADRRQPQ